MIDGHEDAWPPPLSATGEGSDSELAVALGLFPDNVPPPLDRWGPLLGPSALERALLQVTWDELPDEIILPVVRPDR